MDARSLAAAGLEVRRDAVGNTFARWAGSQPELPAVAVGAFGGLDAIRALQAAGYQPRHAVELIVPTAAEPAGFGIHCLGSRLLSGAMPVWKAARLTGADGKTFDEWRAEMGFEGPLESVALAPGHYAAFVELSVEPGGPPLGIVTGFAAPAGLRVTVESDGGRDALCAAAEIALEVGKIAPGAVDSVPGGSASRVRLEIHVEDIDQAHRDGMVNRIAMACRDIAQRWRLMVKAEVLHMDPPAESAAAVVDALARAARAHSLACQRVVGRGDHDALFLSRIAPAGTLLVSGPAEAANGARVLAGALSELAG